MSERELDHRVTRLEHQMIEVQEDTSAAYTLARTADRDVSEFRAVLRGHTEVINALRKDQVERFARLDSKMQEGFTTVNLGMTQILALLTIAQNETDEDQPISKPCG